MIARSRSAKFLAVLLAGSAHGALALALMAQDPAVEIEGSGPAGEAALGSSFADMAAGSLSAVPPEDLTEVEPLEAPVQPPETPTETTEPLQAEPVEPLQAARTEPAPVAPAEAPSTPVAPAPPLTAAESPDVVAALAPPEPNQPEPPELIEPEPEPEAAEPVVPDEPVQAEPSEAEVPEVETVEAEAPEPTEPEEATEEEEVPETALASSLRPVERPDSLRKPEPAPQPQRRAEPEPERRQAQPRPTQQGNAERNARAGQEQGNEAATASRSGAGGRADSSGNAAASNYPGQVMRKLSRVSRPRMNARGAAVVAFSIAGSGGLSGVSLARSSGSAALDRAALQVVQRAAPFPAPPPGARRNYSIEIKAR